MKNPPTKRSGDSSYMGGGKWRRWFTGCVSSLYSLQPPQWQLPLQLPPEGQPMHTAPRFFSLMMYLMAAPRMTATTAMMITFVILLPFASYLLSAGSASLFTLRIRDTMMAAMAATTIRPGRKPAPKLPVVISVPI